MLAGLACSAGSARASLPLVEALAPDGAAAVPAAPAPAPDVASEAVSRVRAAAPSPRVTQAPVRVVGRARASADAVTQPTAPRVPVAPRAQPAGARSAVRDGGARTEPGSRTDDTAQPAARQRPPGALAGAGADSAQDPPPRSLPGEALLDDASTVIDRIGAVSGRSATRGPGARAVLDGLNAASQAVRAEALNGAPPILADRVDVARRLLDGAVAAPRALLDRVDATSDAVVACAMARPHPLLDCARATLRDGVTSALHPRAASTPQQLPSVPGALTDGQARDASRLPGGAAEPHASKRALAGTGASAHAVALRAGAPLTATRPAASQLPATTAALLAADRAARGAGRAPADGSAPSPAAAAAGGGASGSAPCDRAAAVTARPLSSFSTHAAARRLPPPAPVVTPDARPD